MAHDDELTKIFEQDKPLCMRDLLNAIPILQEHSIWPDDGEFHMYSAQWNDKGITHTIDGKPISTAQAHAIAAMRGGTWVFDPAAGTLTPVYADAPAVDIEQAYPAAPTEPWPVFDMKPFVDDSAFAVDSVKVINGDLPKAYEPDQAVTDIMEITRGMVG